MSDSLSESMYLPRGATVGSCWRRRVRRCSRSRWRPLPGPRSYPRDRMRWRYWRAGDHSNGVPRPVVLKLPPRPSAFPKICANWRLVLGGLKRLEVCALNSKLRELRELDEGRGQVDGGPDGSTAGGGGRVNGGARATAYGIAHDGGTYWPERRGLSGCGRTEEAGPRRGRGRAGSTA